MRQVFLFFAFTVFLLTGEYARGQNAIYKHYTIKDGLPSNKIYGISEDKNGQIWIGTDRGITRFNGKSFRVFTVADGLPTNDIFYSYHDPEGRVWMYDYSPSVTYIQNDTVHVLKVFDKSTPFKKQKFNYHNGLAFTAKYNNHIIFATGQSVAVINVLNGLKKIFPDYNTARSKTMNFYTFHGKSFVLHDYTNIKYYRDLSPIPIQYHYQPQSDSFPFKTYRFGPSLFKDRYLYSIPSEQQDRLRFIDLWTGKVSDILFQDLIKGFTHLRSYDAFDDQIQFSTNNGLTIVDSNLNISERFELPDNLKKDEINAIYKDRANSYWISTYNDGIYFISKHLKDYDQLVPSSAMLASQIIKLFYHDKRYYLFNERHEVIIADTLFNIVKRIFLPSYSTYQSDQRKTFLLPDEKKGYYIISSRGIYYLTNKDELHSIQENKDSIGENFLEYGINAVKNCVYDDRTKSVLYLNYNSVSRIWYDGVFHHRDIIKKRYTNISQGPAEDYWLSDDLGNILIFDSTFQKKKHNYNIDNPITYQSNDGRGHVVFAVDGKGIVSCNERFTGMQQVYTGGDVQAVKTDTSGIWVATNQTIRHYRYTGNKYGLSDIYPNLGGLIYEEVYSIELADKNLVLLCDKGIIRLPRHNDHLKKDLQFSRSVHVRGLRIGKDRQYYLPAGTSSYQLPFTRDNINLYFTSNSTTYLGDLSYQYYLEGNDRDWQSTDDEEVSYPSLKPGSYTLHLKAVIQHASISTDEYLFQIEVLPAWWQTWWFNLILLLLGAGAGGFIVFLVIRRNKQRALRQAAIDKRMAGLELTALQAQMNPHFIFNALSSIQSFINSKDSSHAEDLLQKFSMLIRLYLEFSRHQYITLRQELKVLELYTSIERMRFGNRFDVVMRTRGGQADKVNVPPMLIQPLVENAINHGLYHKKEKGLLKVIILIKEDCTVIVVDDDGIGREAARKLRRKLFPSRGNQILNERIETLKLSGLAQAGMTITDKKDKFGSSMGTRVILTLQTPGTTAL